jgi:S1-C subfamily serine protease
MLAPTFRKPEIGVSFNCERDKHPVIDVVELGSPAHDAGLLKGDRLLSVSAATAISTAKTEVKGLDAVTMQGLLTQTFDAASRGATMMVHVERGQGAGVKVLEKVLKKVEKAPWPQGIGLSFNCFTGQAPLIAKVDPGSHAHDAGLLMGDRLLSVSATTAISTIRTEVEGFNADQLIGLLRQTFHAASQCGGKMGLEVERVQNGAVKVLNKVFEKMGNAPLQYVPSPQAPLQYATSPNLVSYAPLQYATSPTLVPATAGPPTIGLDVDCQPGQQPTIVHVHPGSPAHNAGLVQGDRIISVTATNMPNNKTVVPGVSTDHIIGVLKQTFDAATKAGGKMIVQVERGQGGAGHVFFAELSPIHMAPMQVLEPPQYVTSPQLVQSGPIHMAPMQVLEPPQYVTSPQLVQSGPIHMAPMQVLEPPQYVTSPQLVQSGPNHMSSMQVLGPIAWDNAPGFAPMTPAPAMFEPLREMPAPGLHITRVA